MTMTIEIKLNGTVVTLLTVHNKGAKAGETDPFGVHLYEWHDGKRGGTVEHSRADGSEALAAKLLEAHKPYRRPGIGPRS